MSFPAPHKEDEPAPEEEEEPLGLLFLTSANQALYEMRVKDTLKSQGWSRSKFLCQPAGLSLGDEPPKAWHLRASGCLFLDPPLQPVRWSSRKRRSADWGISLRAGHPANNHEMLIRALHLSPDCRFNFGVKYAGVQLEVTRHCSFVSLVHEIFGQENLSFLPKGAVPDLTPSVLSKAWQHKFWRERLHPAVLVLTRLAQTCCEG